MKNASLHVSAVEGVLQYSLRTPCYENLFSDENRVNKERRGMKITDCCLTSDDQQEHNIQRHQEQQRQQHRKQHKSIHISTRRALKRRQEENYCLLSEQDCFENRISETLVYTPRKKEEREELSYNKNIKTTGMSTKTHQWRTRSFGNPFSQ